MRSLIVMAMFASSLTYATWNGYTETRDLELPTHGVDILEIDAGAGSIVVNGVADASVFCERALRQGVRLAHLAQACTDLMDHARPPLIR